MSSFRIGLLFHGIGAPRRELEPGEVPYWLQTSIFETILDRVAAAPEPQAFCISFDDGNASDHDIALPRLVERGLSADFFVLSGRTGQPGSLSAEKILALQAAGMRIGSHGIGHHNLSKLSLSDLNEELWGSRRALEEICGCPVTELGLPFGAYNRQVLTAARTAGYQAVYSSNRGWMRNDRFLRPRISLHEKMGAKELDDIFAGRLRPRTWLRRTASAIRWRFFK